MAGGADWFLESKDDGDNAYTLGTGAEVEHWRREEITFVITKDVPPEMVNLDAGDKGKSSGTLVCKDDSGRVHERILSNGKVFMCQGDSLRKGEQFTGFYLRTQTWVRVGEDRQYDPATGLDL
jgi:hypothetical protein